MSEEALKEAFGTVSMVLACSIALYALPAQIRKHYRDKRCGLVTPYVILLLVNLLTRDVYAILLQSWYIAIPDTIGLVLMSIIAWQCWHYHRQLTKGE